MNASGPPSTSIHCLHLAKNTTYNLWLGALRQIEVWKIIIKNIKIYLKYEISILFHYFKDNLMTKLTLG